MRTARARLSREGRMATTAAYTVVQYCLVLYRGGKTCPAAPHNNIHNWAELGIREFHNSAYVHVHRQVVAAAVTVAYLNYQGEEGGGKGGKDRGFLPPVEIGWTTHIDTYTWCL